MASVTEGFNYDLFLSFRGEDTHYGFTGYLWKALHDRGIRTIMDEEDLQKGDEITPALVNAIQQSRMAIIVLSKNYASSFLFTRTFQHHCTNYASSSDVGKLTGIGLMEKQWLTCHHHDSEQTIANMSWR